MCRTRPVRGGRHVVVNLGRPEIVGEPATQVVVPDTADIRRSSTERGEPDHRVRDRTSRAGQATGELLQQAVGRGLVHEIHRALLDPERGDGLVVDLDQYVDDRVADAQHVVFRVHRDFLRSNRQNSETRAW